MAMAMPLIGGDDCIRDKDMSIAINSKSDVFEWTEKDTFHFT